MMPAWRTQGRFQKSGLFDKCSWPFARRVGSRDSLDGKSSVRMDAREIWPLGRLMIFFFYFAMGTLKNTLGLSRVRVGYTAGEAIGPEIVSDILSRSARINLKQAFTADKQRRRVFITRGSRRRSA